MVLIKRFLSHFKYSRIYSRARPLRWGLRRIDQLVQQGLDQVLPKSLTTRYIIGLGTIAVLSIAGQILIQVSLLNQFETQKMIWHLDRQIPHVEELRKSALALQLSSNHADARKRIDNIQNVIGSLRDSEKPSLREFSMFGKEKPNPTETETLKALERLSIATNELTQRFPLKSHGLPHQLDEELPGRTKEVIDSAATFEAEIKQNIRVHEEKINAQITRFKKTELILLCCTLLVLILEALYVFRPAVTRLYTALRIRSDFLSRMSHELRNPMNSIIGMASLLGETSVSDQQRNYISMLRRSSKSLLEILNGLLDFSSMEAGVVKLENTEFDLYELVERCLDLTIVTAHANETELILDLSLDVPQKIFGDSLRLQQVLSNLLGNAAKFTKKGEIMLRVETEAEIPRPTLRFSVIDTGIGIDKEQILNVFEPFVQEDTSIRRRYGGSGLGLTIAKDIVKRMNSKLEVTSEKNKGSCFTFAIPIASPELLSPSGDVNLKLPSTFTAFVLEENKSVMTALEKTLKHCGATEISSGDLAALKDFLKDVGNNKVALVNYEQIRGQLDNLGFPFNSAEKGLIGSRIIFLLDAMISTADIERLIAFGGKIFLFKPVKPLQLYDALRTAVAGVELLAKTPHQGRINAVPNVACPTRFNVLIADDSKENQFLFKAYLQFLPCDISMADDGKQAVEIFKEKEFDIVLMDVQMPELDGYAAVGMIRAWEKLQNHKSIVPILGISAYSMSDRAHKAGFSAYLVKPVAPQALRKNVSELLSLGFQESSPSNEESTKEELPMNTPEKNNVSSLTSHTSHESIHEQLERRMAELAPMYLENRKKELIELKKFAATPEIEAVARIGHRLKGNALSYGFPELGKLGSELEKAAQQEDIAGVQRVIANIEIFLQNAKPPKFPV